MQLLPLLGLVSLSFACGILLLIVVRTQRRIDAIKTELESLREEQRSDRMKLVERSDLDSAKDEFISTVSHELRTPLTSIRGALGLLSSGVLGNVDAKAQNLLRIASTNTERLIRLINDILDLERMESGNAPLQKRRCSLFKLATEAIEVMSAMAHGAEVQLQLSTSAVADAMYFDSDSDRILQVLTNLLSNAIKFSPPSSTVAVQIESGPDSLLLKVVDHGRGIPSDKLESIFDRFQQVETSDARQKGGTGLGLAICKSIVQQHGGFIWAQPNEGEPGTTLWVQFSRAGRQTDRSAISPGPTHQRGEGLVLVCDDDPGIRTVVAEQLRQHGYSILEAGSGEEAIAIASRPRREAPLSAILLDLYMPGLSGWETLQRLKTLPASAGIPVVILSVISPAEQTQRTSDAQGWIQKPFNENLLLAELGRVLHTGDGPVRVLLVEDDQDLASVVIASFANSSMQVDHASTSQQAMDYCLLNSPDLMILDLTLPDGDGFSIVEWLRRHPGLRMLPLVVYSGRDISASEMVKLRLGPTKFLSKATVQPQEVESLVNAMVQNLRSGAASAA